MKNLQFSGNLYDERITLKQVSKTTAKKLFCAGETIYLQSSNMLPLGVWQSVCPVSLDKDSLNSKQELFDWYEKEGYLKEGETRPDENYMFNLYVNEYYFFNCDSERGRYVHFYKSI